jgi:hypothetical protein
MATKSKTTSSTTDAKSKPSKKASAPETQLAPAKKALPAKKEKKASHGMSRGQKIAAAAVGVAAVTAAGVAVAVARRSKETVLHVEPKGERWQVQVEGNKKASGIYDTKKEALDAARTMAHKRTPSELVVHRADGTEQDRHKYED